MSKNKEIIEHLTNEAQREKFNSELGSKAVVERSVIERDERTDQLDAVLCDIGRDFNETHPTLKGMKYLGSIAAHVYLAEATGVFANVKQINPHGCPPELLMRLGEDLAKATMEYSGRKSPKLRSGW